MAFAIYEAPTTIDTGVFGETVNLGESVSTSTQAETARIVPSTLQEEGSFGNAIRLGGLIFKIFIRGLVGLPIDPNGLGNGLEQLAFIVLVMFKAVMYMLIILEIYLVIKNRKQT